MNDEEYTCTCGHSDRKHFAPGTKCLGSHDCQCRVSRNAVLAEGREKTIIQQRQTIDTLATALLPFCKIELPLPGNDTDWINCVVRTRDVKSAVDSLEKSQRGSNAQNNS